MLIRLILCNVYKHYYKTAFSFLKIVFISKCCEVSGIKQLGTWCNWKSTLDSNSNLSVVDYFPITSQPQVFYSLHVTAKLSLNLLNNIVSRYMTYRGLQPFLYVLHHSSPFSTCKLDPHYQIHWCLKTYR